MCFVDKIRLVVDSDKELSRRAGRVYLYLVFFFYKINKKLLISFEVNWWISAFGWMGRSLRGQEGSQVGRLHEQWYILSCCWVANQKTCVYTLQLRVGLRYRLRSRIELWRKRQNDFQNCSDCVVSPHFRFVEQSGLSFGMKAFLTPNDIPVSG